LKNKVFLFLLLLFLVPSAASADIVNTSNIYTYEDMTNDIKELNAMYPDLVTYESIGKSHFGRDIWAVKLGKGEPSVFINGSHHAREWISTMIVMKMIESYSDAYINNRTIGSFQAKNLLDDEAIAFVPMVNPDGVTLQQEGLKAFPSSHHKALLSMNNGSFDFKRWKANAMGIDLNRQYPANWDAKSTPTFPSWSNYKGNYPFQAKEVMAIRDYTYKIRPKIAVAYHSSGRILYWHFHNKSANYNRDYGMAKSFSSMTGYSLVKPETNPAGKGFTDWFIQEFGYPGFTPELSYYVGNTHVPLSVFPNEWERNKSIGLWLVSEAKKITPITTGPFYDVSDSHWAYSSILHAKNKNYIGGVSEGKFAPNQSVTRSQMAVVLVRVLGLPKYVPEKPSFSDVASSNWAYEGIETAKYYGIFSGKSEFKFGPNNPLTREEMAAALTRLSMLPSDSPKSMPFKDVPATRWSASSIFLMKQLNIIGGVGNGYFKPRGILTRAEAAALLYKIDINQPDFYELFKKEHAS